MHTPAAYSENVGASAGHFPCPDGIWLTDGVEACFQHRMALVAVPHSLERLLDIHPVHTASLFYSYRIPLPGTRSEGAERSARKEIVVIESFLKFGLVFFQTAVGKDIVPIDAVAFLKIIRFSE